LTTQAQPNNNNAGRWVLLTTILASSMAFIDSSALNVALDAMQKDLKASGADLIWIVNIYTLLLASLILLGGSLGDHFGRNRIFRIGIILFAAASFVCGISPTVGILIAARAVQGLGGALMVPGSLAIISASFPEAQRGRAIGTWSSFGTITTILAPALGGFLANAGLWRGVFFINIPLAVFAVLALTRVPETKDDDTPRELDYAGTALIVVGLSGLTYGAIGLGQANESGTFDPTPLIALAVGVVALVGFVLVEARSKHPLVPLALFKQRTFSGTNLMTVFFYGALSGALFFFPLNLIQIQGYPPNVAGLTLLPLSLALAVLSPIMGGLVMRIGPRVLLTVGPVIVGLAFIWLGSVGLTAGPDAYWTTFFPGIVLLGVGLGITVAPLTTAVMGAVPSHEAGVASGVNNAVARSAQGLAVAALGGLALVSFSNGLAGQLANRNIAPDVRQQVQGTASKLGNTEIPKDLDEATSASIRQSIQGAFVEMFRLVFYIGAGLSFISAICSAILIENKRTATSKPT